MATELKLSERIVLNAVFAKIDKTAFSLASGLVFFLSMFVITAISIIKTNGAVGPDLEMLSYYLPGYSVTWLGNIVGSVYIGVIGLVLGWFFGMLWNLTHYLYLAVLMNKINLFKID
ncbi:MAG: hypothetical protein JKX87_00135 [Cycloclasticus sp.]|nr:hypothetical protein [Cycloclasticus sp.]